MARSDNLTGAFLMMGSMACFVLNDTLMKLMAGQIPLNQILFLRGVLTSLAVAGMAWRMRGLFVRPSQADRRLIFWRTAAEVGGAYCFLTALFNMPLANVTAIMAALPLTVTLGVALFYGEPIGWRRMLAIGVGFGGVMLIVRPGTEGFTIYALYGLGAVVFVTMRDLTTRGLSKETPSIFVTLINSLAIMVVFGFASLLEPWVTMDLRATWLTIGAALFVIGGYLFSIMVMRVGEISFVAPFRYSGLVFALALGWLAFGDWPDPLTLLGAGIVMGSGLFTLYREAQLARKRGASPALRRH